MVVTRPSLNLLHNQSKFKVANLLLKINQNVFLLPNFTNHTVIVSEYVAIKGVGWGVPVLCFTVPFVRVHACLKNLPQPNEYFFLMLENLNVGLGF